MVGDGTNSDRTLTLMVSSMVRNFLLSPISMALLISGTASFTASSMGTGGMFSPPAVMISSAEKQVTGVQIKTVDG